VLVVRIALGLLYLIVRLIHLLVLATYFALAAVAALVMGVIGLVILAFMAAEEKRCAPPPSPRCARSWAGAGPAMSRAAEMR
jgi:hypothetical protein